VEADRGTGFFKGEIEMSTRETNAGERVNEILQDHLGSDVTFSSESDLLHDLGLDSLEQVELGLKLEKDFNIKIPIKDLRSCVTVGEVIQLVQLIISQKEAQSA
jgi:acyl carrier protein